MRQGLFNGYKKLTSIKYGKTDQDGLTYPVKSEIGWLEKGGYYDKNLLYPGAAFVLLIAFAGQAQSLDFSSLADQSSYRCSGGVVALGDSHRHVREKCGAPIKIATQPSIKS
jgi:hypothetical protein